MKVNSFHKQAPPAAKKRKSGYGENAGKAGKSSHAN
jgi:hypothetical protein